MKWTTIIKSASEMTEAMEMAEGVLVRTSTYDEVGVSEALCFVPNARINEGGCSERAQIVRRTGTR